MRRLPSSTGTSQTAVLGVQTNVEFLRFLLADERVRAGDLEPHCWTNGWWTSSRCRRPRTCSPRRASTASGPWLSRAPQRRDNLWAAPTDGASVAAAPVRTAMRTPLRTETVSCGGHPWRQGTGR